MEYIPRVQNNDVQSELEKRRPGFWVEATIVLVLLLVFLTISLSSMRQKNATFDEVLNIPAGYTYVALHDFRMWPEHPPLVKALSGISLLLLRPNVDLSDPTWQNRKQGSFGPKFLYQWNDADRVVFFARVPVVLLTILLGLGVFFCAREFYGWQAGYFALALYLFNPEILAHGQVVTTDLGLSCFLFLSVYTFYRALQQVTVWRVLFFSLCVGLTLVTKFSGVLVFPTLLLVGVAFAISKTPVSVASLKKEVAPRLLIRWKDKLYIVVALLLFSVAVSLVIIWACYGFRYRMSPDPLISSTIDWQHFWMKKSLTTSFLHMAHSLRLFPESYTYGFLYILESIGDRSSYLLGEYSDSGWWYYFFVTFVIKTPIPLLLLILLGFLFIKRYGGGFAAEAMLLLPVGFYWIIAILSNINIGNRHLLPVYPFLIIFAAKLAGAFQAPVARRLAGVCALLLVWNIVGTTLIYPHYLAYFNEIAGGPSNGHRWVTDSNLDWGQDLKGLAVYRQQHPEEPFYLSYFGMASPDYYGIKAEYLLGFNAQVQKKLEANEVVAYEQIPSGALVAISATNLSGVYLRHFDFPGTAAFLERLRSMQPIDNIGHSILIYRMP